MNKLTVKIVSFASLITFILNQGLYLPGIHKSSVSSVHYLSPASVAQTSLIPAKMTQLLEAWESAPEIPATFDLQFERYYQLKLEMVEAADQNLEDDFRKKYKELLALVEPLSQAARKATDEKLLELLKTTISKQKLPAFILGGQQVSPDQVALSIEETRRELESVGQVSFNSKTEKIIHQVVEEVVQELYSDKSKKSQMRQQILDDIQTNHIKNILGLGVLQEDFSLWRKFCLNSLISLPRLMAAYGTMSPELGTISVGPTEDELVLRCTLKHELVHYLAHHGEIKIPHDWENITYAVDILERVRQVGEDSLDTYKEDFGLDLLKELFLRGKQMGFSGDMGFILRPGVSDNRAGYFSTDILILEARKIYAENGVNADFLLDPYQAQKAAGILLGGILTGMVQKNKDLKPLAMLRDFFYVASQRWAPPSKEEVERIEKKGGLLEELQQYASSLSGTRVKMVPSTSGLWQYEKLTERSANLNYVISDLYPRSVDGKKEQDIQIQRVVARERGLGQVLLAINKIVY